jgi:hypothetical protein
MDEKYISVIACGGFSGRASGGGASHAGLVRYTSLRAKRPKSRTGQALYRQQARYFRGETVGPACSFVSPHGGLEELHRRSGVGEETPVCAKGWLADGEQGDERYRCDTHTCTVTGSARADQACKTRRSTELIRQGFPMSR